MKLDFNSGVWESVSKPARDLLSRMLTRDESARITADEVLSKPFSACSIIEFFCLSLFNAYYMFTCVFQGIHGYSSTQT